MRKFQQFDYSQFGLRRRRSFLSPTPGKLVAAFAIVAAGMLAGEHLLIRSWGAYDVIKSKYLAS